MMGWKLRAQTFAADMLFNGAAEENFPRKMPADAWFDFKGCDRSLVEEQSFPYHEFRHLVITGRLLRPAGMKTDRIEVSLLPVVDMNPGQRKELEPLAVGSLES